MQGKVPNETVNRIYRSLFVYTVGFSELIKTSLEHSDNNYILIANIWKVFSILLEYSGKSEYQLMVSKMGEAHRQQIEEANEKFDLKLLKYIMNERELREANQDLQEKLNNAEENEKKHKDIIEKLQDEISENKKNHESEVAMRLKFESKLNQVHALYRDIETRYERACEDIDELAKSNKDLINLNDRQRGSLSDLTAEKVKFQTEINFSSSQIKHQLRENESKQRKLNEFEIMITEVQNNMDKLQEELVAERDISKHIKIDLEGKETTISGLKYERSRLEDALRELKKMNEQYLKRYEEEKIKFEKSRDELQYIQREEMAYKKISNDFDTRVAEMNKENSKLKTQLYEIEKVADAGTQLNEVLSTRNASLIEQNEKIAHEIQEINSLKNQYKLELDGAAENIVFLKTQIAQKNITLKKDKKDNDRLSRRLAAMEQTNDALEIEKKAYENATKVHKQQLNDQIKIMSGSLRVEKDAREKWVQRYDREHKSFTDLSLENVRTIAKLKELEIKYESSQITVDKQQKQIKIYLEKHNDMLLQLNQKENECVEVQRSLRSVRCVLDSVEEIHDAKIKELKTNIEEVEHQISLLNKQIE